jgi:hypothetical protein
LTPATRRAAGVDAQVCEGVGAPAGYGAEEAERQAAAQTAVWLGKNGDGGTGVG